jgi:hypothetical protein
MAAWRRGGRQARLDAHPLAPPNLATTAVARAWLDWMPPIVMTLSWPRASASAMRNSSLRTWGHEPACTGSSGQLGLNHGGGARWKEHHDRSKLHNYKQIVSNQVASPFKPSLPPFKWPLQVVMGGRLDLVLMGG